MRWEVRAGGQLGNSGFSPAHRTQSSWARASSRARGLQQWPTVPGQDAAQPPPAAPTPQGLPDPGQGDQTPRLSLELEQPLTSAAPAGVVSPHPPATRLLCLLASSPQGLRPSPTPSHRCSLCCNTGPVPGARLRFQRLLSFQRKLIHRIVGWGRSWGGGGERCRSQPQVGIQGPGAPEGG